MRRHFLPQTRTEEIQITGSHAGAATVSGTSRNLNRQAVFLHRTFFCDISRYMLYSSTRLALGVVAPRDFDSDSVIAKIRKRESIHFKTGECYVQTTP
jgi:hypothetical protein